MATVRLVDDQDPDVIYQGSWHSSSHADAFNSTLTYATEANSTAVYTFEGDRISVSGYVSFCEQTGPPTAAFQIDTKNDDEAHILYEYTPRSTTNLTYPVYFSSSNLPNTTHTLTVTITSNNDARFYLDSILASSGLGAATVAGNVLESAEVFSSPSAKHSDLAGAAVGGAVGGAFFVGSILLLYYHYLVRRRRGVHKRTVDSEEPSIPFPDLRVSREGAATTSQNTTSATGSFTSPLYSSPGYDASHSSIPWSEDRGATGMQPPSVVSSKERYLPVPPRAHASSTKTTSCAAMLRPQLNISEDNAREWRVRLCEPSPNPPNSLHVLVDRGAAIPWDPPPSYLESAAAVEDRMSPAGPPAAVA